MREKKKMNRVLLYLIGFMCGHSAIFGMNPFLVPAFAAVFYMRQSTFGLLVSMFLGRSVAICGKWMDKESYI